MKNTRKNNEIRREDFFSFFLWKAFWKLIRQETLSGFLLKVFLVCLFFIALLFFQMSLGTWVGD